MLRHQRFLVVGLVRNCARHLPHEVARLAAALSGARAVAWLLVESDSDDATGAVLAALRERTPGFDYLALGRLRDRIALRTERIAHCRNAYLAAIRDDPRYADVDCVLVADFDGVNGSLTRAALESCWLRDDWDVCTANQAGPYYDLWALRHGAWSPNDCFEQYRFHLARGQSAAKAYFAAVYARMIRIQPESGWLEVDSAFGGLALYRRQALLEGRYLGLTDDGRELCEHVPYHRDLKARGRRIYINPRLINARRTGHTLRVLLMLVGLLLLGDRGLQRLRQGWR